MRSAAANSRTPTTRITLAVFMDAPTFRAIRRKEVKCSSIYFPTVVTNFGGMKDWFPVFRFRPDLRPRKARLIRRWLLCRIDDETVDLTLGRFEFQSKLLLNRCGERGNWVRRGC